MMSSDSIPVRRWPKPNLKGNPDTNVYVSVMAQFSKDTYLFFKLSRSKSKTPNNIHLLCEGVQSAGQYCSNIINKPTRVVGIGPVPKQTKESVRRDKRPSSVYCVSVSCLYCVKHLLVGASQSTVCWPILVSICWSTFVSICRPTFLNSCRAICSKNSCRVFALPLPPSAGQGIAVQGREGHGREGTCWRYRGSSN